jgi:sigma-B regulation protein RsbU (phosphoserine phosphatase)
VNKSAAEVLNVKAASIRLLDDEERELLPKSVYNLSREYLNKGPVLLSGSPIDLQATSGEVVYVSDMASDPRILYPADAAREGLASILVVGLVYRGRKVGVMRIYSDQVRQFSEDERQLLRAVAQLSAAAIEHARLDEARQQAERVRRQVQLAADVQRRMMPTSKTHMPPFDIAARYEPCFELGGDFFDLIPIERTLGLVVGDVVGKGVAAGLLMASVRASLRAYIEDVYDLDEIMAKVNAAMTRETRDDEFATVFYGTLDADSLRLTYCSAGHDPALLLRDGQFTELGIGGMAVGVSREQRYEKGLITLRGGDVLLMHTDGVTDAMNFGGEKFGRQRLHQAVLDAAEQDAQSIVNHVLWEVRRFIGLNAPSDDITLLAVKVDPGYRANAYMI